MAEFEVALRSEFPEATEAEIKRFVRSCLGPKIPPDEVKRRAEEALENYLDWRSCYGLDYKDESNTNTDAEDWKFAIEKSLEVTASMRRTQAIEKKLAEEQEQVEAAAKAPVSYEIDISDSQQSENDEKEENGKVNGVGDRDSGDTEIPEDFHQDEVAEMSDEEMKKRLQQMIFLHQDKDGKPLIDKSGSKILHVLPGLINRKVAQADFYSLALTFYLDRKFDRATEETMTVVIDVRAGDGWPNPSAFMMVKFARTVTKHLQAHYPERLKSLIVFPVPWAAMGVWSAMKVVFRLDIMNKTTLISGPADSAAPLPREKLKEIIEGEVLDLMEDFRTDHFTPIGTSTSD